MINKTGLCVGITASLLILALAGCGPTMATSTPSSEPATPTEEKPTAEPPAPTPTDSPSSSDKPEIDEDALVTASGLQYIEIEKGDGPAPEQGKPVVVHYTGTLEDGTEFDSSISRNKPFIFPLGMGYVIPGWDEGIALMNVGGKAKLIVPPELAYGEQGAGGVIPPNATLIFEVELVDVLPGAPEAPTEVDEADLTTTDSGLQYYDFEVGTGPEPTEGQQIVVNYTGWLEDGTKFDSSLDRGEPIVFPVGTGQVISGWDEGLLSMKAGGKRQLVIPPELGYGEAGAGGVIPPNATLIFEVELVEIY